MIDAKILNEEYWVREKSTRKIAEELGVDSGTVCYWMKKHNIPLRSRSEALVKKPDLSPSSTLAYILGVLLGDGCVSYAGNRSYRVILDTYGDPAFNHSFEMALRGIGLNAWTHSGIKPPSSFQHSPTMHHRTVANSKVFYEWYKKLEWKSIEQIARMYSSDFLRGFYESEGYIGVQELYSKTPHKTYGPYQRKYVGLLCTNEKVINLCWELTQLLGFRPTKVWRQESIDRPPLRPKGKPMFHFQIGKAGEAERFIQLICPTIKIAPAIRGKK